MCLIQCLILNGHLYSSVVGLDVNLKTNTKKIFVKKKKKIGLRAQSEHNDQHNGGGET